MAAQIARFGHTTNKFISFFATKSSAYKQLNVIVANGHSALGQQLVINLLNRGDNVTIAGKDNYNILNIVNGLKMYTESNISHLYYDDSDINGVANFMDICDDNIDVFVNLSDLNFAKENELINNTMLLPYTIIEKMTNDMGKVCNVFSYNNITTQYMSIIRKGLQTRNQENDSIVFSDMWLSNPITQENIFKYEKITHDIISMMESNKRISIDKCVQKK